MVVSRFLMGKTKSYHVWNLDIINDSQKLLQKHLKHLETEYGAGTKDY